MWNMTLVALRNIQFLFILNRLQNWGHLISSDIPWRLGRFKYHNGFLLLLVRHAGVGSSLPPEARGQKKASGTPQWPQGGNNEPSHNWKSCSERRHKKVSFKVLQKSFSTEFFFLKERGLQGRGLSGELGSITSQTKLPNKHNTTDNSPNDECEKLFHVNYIIVRHKTFLIDPPKRLVIDQIQARISKVTTVLISEGRHVDLE